MPIYKRPNFNEVSGPDPVSTDPQCLSRSASFVWVYVWRGQTGGDQGIAVSVSASLNSRTFRYHTGGLARAASDMSTGAKWVTWMKEWARLRPKGSSIYTELQRGSPANTLSHGDQTKNTCARLAPHQLPAHTPDWEQMASSPEGPMAGWKWTCHHLCCPL